MSTDRTGNLTRAAATQVLAVCFAIVLLDGLDTTSIAYVVPVLSRAWRLAEASFTPAFVATSVGATLGYLASGPMARRFGYRPIGFGSVVVFGGATLLTALSGDLATLSVLRVVAAVGLGGTLPLALAVSSGATASDRSATATMVVATGFSAGGVVGGLAGGALIRAFGWQAIFVAGGALPFLLLPLFLRALTMQPKRSAGPGTNPIAELFGNGLAARSALLWVFAFLVFLVAYALAYWIPTLLTTVGVSPDRAPLGTAAFGVGGLVGNIVVMGPVDRWGVKPVLALASLGSIVCIALLGGAPVSPVLALVLIAGAGAGLITCSVGQSVLAVTLYPTDLRMTGIGWAAAFGRIGSIVGPAAGGAMLALGWPARTIVLCAVVPAVAAIVALGVLSRAGERAGLAARET